MIGTLLSNRYRLDAEMGQGGLGAVYRAYDTLLDRPVAVKVVTSSRVGGTEGRARLLREAQIAGRLNHTNIVSIYDAGQAPLEPGAAATAFIVMELVDGPSLHECPPADLEGILRVGRQICAALEHAHGQGIIHRDLKPENVVMSGSGPASTAKLTDFGLARSLHSRVSEEGTISGSVLYMAPEQALGEPVDGRTDIYALGVILYELTAGRLPFQADDPLATISQHLNAPVVPPRAYHSAIPPALDALIVQLLAKRPDDRPADARSVARELERVAAGDAVVAATAEPPALAHLARGRMVGRARELAEATAVLRSALNGEGQVLLVSGEPGVGKTRLVRELLAQAAVLGARVLTAENYPETCRPYGAVATLLEDVCHFDAPLSTLPPFVQTDLLTLAPALAGCLAAELAAGPLEPSAQQTRLYDSFATLCAMLAARQPLVLLVDDAHWADSGTLFLLRHLARRARKQPVLIVMTYRETEVDLACCLDDVLAELNRERLSVRLKLSRLDRPATRDLLSALLSDEAPGVLADAIYQETEGNPFFVEEVVKGLLEEGQLVYEDGRVRGPADLQAVAIPQSVRQAVGARITKMPAATQEILRLAAVIGREFDFDTLQQAAGLPEDSLIEALEKAEQAQLIAEIPGRGRAGGVSFAFAHGLIPATLRDGIGALRRPRMHRHAAEAIAIVRPLDYEALAHHYSEAHDIEQARTYYVKAGERALAHYAYAEAERHYRAALDLAANAGGDEEGGGLVLIARPGAAYASAPPPLLAGLGEALFGQSRFGEAITTWEEGIARCRAAGQADEAARLYARAARAAWNLGDMARGLALSRVGLAETAGSDGPGHALLLHEAARSFYFNGLPKEALPLCEQALDAARRLGLVEVQADALTTRGLLWDREHRRQEAIAAYEEAIRLAEGARLFTPAARAYHNLAYIAGQEVGDFQVALRHYERAAALSRQTGVASLELFEMVQAATVMLGLGDLASVEAGLPALRQLAARAGETGSPARMVDQIVVGLQRMRGDLAGSVRRLREMLASARQQGDLQVTALLDNQLGDILTESGAWDEAEAVLKEGLEAGEGMGWAEHSLGLLSALEAFHNRPEAARSWLEKQRAATGSPAPRIDATFLRLSEARVLAAEANRDAAIAAYEDVARDLAAGGLRWQRARVLLELAEVHVTRAADGDFDAARALLGEAHDAFAAMTAQFYAEQAASRLAALAQP